MSYRSRRGRVSRGGRKRVQREKERRSTYGHWRGGRYASFAIRKTDSKLVAIERCDLAGESWKREKEREKKKREENRVEAVEWSRQIR